MTARESSRRTLGEKGWTSYRRLVTALHHREPDRVPFDLGGSMVTGINVRALTALRQVLGLPGEAQVLDRVTQMAETGDDVRERLSVDVRSVRPSAPVRPGLAQDLGLIGNYYRLIDEFGREDEFLAVTAQCRVAQVVRHDDDDVGLGRRGIGGVECGRRSKQQDSDEGEDGFHTCSFHGRRAAVPRGVFRGRGERG